MSVDSSLRQSKYPDEVWWVPIDWTPALADATIIGTPTVVGVGLTVDAATQVGNVTRVKISGGDVNDLQPRIECLAEISTGEKLGYNLGINIRAR